MIVVVVNCGKVAGVAIVSEAAVVFNDTAEINLTQTESHKKISTKQITKKTLTDSRTDGRTQTQT